MAEFETDYLAHHGIKGQKWGVRRFQNPDGTRTEAGKARQRSDNGDKQTWVQSHKKEIAIAGGIALAAIGTAVAVKYGNASLDAANKVVVDEGIKAAKAALKKDVVNRKLLSDEELRKRVERLKLEAEFEKLVEKDLYPGREFYRAQAKAIGGKVMQNIGAGAILYGAKAFLQDQFDKKDFANAVYNGGPKKK